MYTPKDFDITRIMRDIVALVGAGVAHTSNGVPAVTASAATGVP